MKKEICKICGQEIELNDDDKIKICAGIIHITLKGNKIGEKQED
jgi:hypothetical protein